MDNQDSADQSDEPSLGRDILEQKRAQEQQSASPQDAETGSSPSGEEEEAWWLKYVDEPEEAAAPAIPDPLAMDSERPLPEPVPPSHLPGPTPVFAPEAVPRSLSSYTSESAVPTPLKIVKVTGGLRRSSRPHSEKKAVKPRREKAKAKAKAKDKGSASGGILSGVAALGKRVGNGINSRKKSLLKLWPYPVGGLALLFGILFILGRMVPPLVVEGIVEEEEQAVLASYSGNVKTIFVKKWEKVQAGEPLIELRSDKLEEAVEGLAARLMMRHEGLFEQHGEEIGKLNRRIVKAEIEYKALVTENQAIDQQIKALQTFLEKRDGGDSEKVQEEGITERISVLSADFAANQSRIAKASGEMATAQSDIGKLMGKVRDLQEKGFLDMANLEEENQYRKLRGKRDQLILMAPVKGSISDLRFKEGEAIEEGETILRIVSDPERIKIVIPEEEIKEYSVGDLVWIREPGEKVSNWKTSITVMAPIIDSDDGTGRSVFLRYPSGSTLLPGQKVAVHLNDPDESGLQRLRRKLSRRFE